MIDEMDENQTSKKLSRSSDSDTPALDNFCRDLNKMAEEGKLDPVIGREKEILRIAQILSRRKKNNPILIGDPGCGKTAIVEGLAMKIIQGNCPRNLVDKKIYTLDLTSVVAGTKYRGQFEERMKVIMQELKANPNIIIFIDEIHTMIGAGNSSGSLDASNIFKPAMARGELQCIGATTFDEYKKHIEKDGALDRRFQKVTVNGSSISETFEILKNIAGKYESYHKVTFSDEVLMACVKLADRYMPSREFPDKAIDVMDELGARYQITIKTPEIIEELKAKAQEIKNKKIDVVRNQNYEEAAELRDKEKKILAKLDVEKEKFQKSMSEDKKIVTLDSVYDVVSNMTNIPISKLDVNQKNVLKNLDSVLSEQVIGQKDAVKLISESIKRNRIGVKDSKKPIGSFIFLGPTGVGKTHLAKKLAKEMFGCEDNLIRLDMSEYQEQHTISRLIGAPPSFVGYEEGGQLTEKVKNQPYSVVLLDEIEKAHKNIFSLLLQILDDGHITDALGKTINFKNCIIIMTSNLGIKRFQDLGGGIGFSKPADAYKQDEERKSYLKKELKNFFAPEFLNRVDDIVYFNSLSEPDIKKVVNIEINELKTRMEDLNYKLIFDESVIDYISKVGFDPEFGARPIKRAITFNLENKISDGILYDTILENTEYTVKYENNEIVII